MTTLAIVPQKSPKRATPPRKVPYSIWDELDEAAGTVRARQIETEQAIQRERDALLHLIALIEVQRAESARLTRAFYAEEAA